MARQEKTFEKWGQLHVFSTCMTIKAEIRSSPARMPRKNQTEARMASDTAKTLKVRTVARLQYLQPVSDGSPAPARTFPGNARQLPGRCPDGENLQKVGTVARFQYLHDNHS